MTPNVLIVDDQPQNRYYLQALLQGHHFRVTTARQGREALQQARQTPPDVVISDLLMPIMDGYSLLRAWKADPALAAIPFVVYTATYTDADDEQLALDLGADAFILKPCEPEVFLERITEVLQRTPAPGAGRRDDAAVDETSILQQYNQALVRKLEQKSLQLEAANATLRRDIERCEQAEQALRLSEERFRLLAQATNDAIWDWDMVRGTRWWSSGFTELFGHAEGVTRRDDPSWTALIHADDRARVLAEFQAALDSDRDRWQCHYRLQRADGSWAQVEDNGRLLRDASGQAVRMIGGLTDVSVQRSLEEQVRRAQRLESVGQLTGGVAHDFNNLLTVVLGNAEMLLEQLRSDDPRRELANTIVIAADRGANLTRRLLAFARRQSLAPAAVDLNELVNDLAPLLRRALGTHIEVRLVLQPRLPRVMVDAAQLEHALLNLCVNARDAMPEGGVLTIATGEEQLTRLDGPEAPPPGTYLTLEVADTGTGIAPEHLPQVFDPFFSTKSEAEGSGLGLAMVYGFVHQSGGQIRLQSELGTGTRFCLLLPMAQADTSPRAPPRAAEARVTGGNEHILLVEDDALVLDYTRTQLESLGYRVSVAASGDQALRQLETPDAPQLLLTDLLMPGIGGHELARRARLRRPELALLYMSGYPGRSVPPSAPAAPVLAKPFHTEALARAVRTALDGRPNS